MERLKIEVPVLEYCTEMARVVQENTWSKSLQSGREHSNLLDHYRRRVRYRYSHRTAPYLLCGNSFQLGTTCSLRLRQADAVHAPNPPISLSEFGASISFFSSLSRSKAQHQQPTDGNGKLSYLAAAVQCLSIHLDSLRGSTVVATAPQLNGAGENDGKVSLRCEGRRERKKIKKPRNHPPYHVVTHSTEFDPVSTCLDCKACGGVVLITVAYFALKERGDTVLWWSMTLNNRYEVREKKKEGEKNAMHCPGSRSILVRGKSSTFTTALVQHNRQCKHLASPCAMYYTLATLMITIQRTSIIFLFSPLFLSFFLFFFFFFFFFFKKKGTAAPFTMYRYVPSP